MPLPKYLRPIRDVEAHGLTGTEKTVRMLVFAPLLVIFSAPTVLAVVLLGLLGAWGIMFLASGADSIITNPSAYSVEAFLLVAFAVLLIFSNIIARTIRRYFLPFG